MTERTRELSPQRIQEILGARRRRYLLYCLFSYANPLYLPDAAHDVTELENPSRNHQLLEVRLRVYMAIYHDHLPVLENAGIVVYTQDDDMIALGPNAEAVRPELERFVRTDPLTPSRN